MGVLWFDIMMYSIEHFKKYLRLDLGDKAYVTNSATIDMYFFVNPNGVQIHGIYMVSGLRAAYQGRLWPTVVPDVC